MILLQYRRSFRRMHVDLVERFSDERKVDHNLQEKTNDCKNPVGSMLSRICDSRNLIKTLNLKNRVILNCRLLWAAKSFLKMFLRA